MPVGLILVNVVFAVSVLVTIPGLLIWAIRTADNDHHPARRPVAVPQPARRLVYEEPLAATLALA